VRPTPPVSAFTPIRLTGWVTEWGSQPSGITFTWDFGGVITLGQVADVSYNVAGTYVVTLTVSEPPCPVGRFDFVTMTLSISAGSLGNEVYLPLIFKSGTGGVAGAVRPGTGGVTLDVAPHSPPQVTGLQGHVQAGGTTLRWNPGPADATHVGYRIYRSSVKTPGFRRLAELPATVTTYTDAAACGYAYFVTAFNAQGESPPSTSSFYSPPCR
jgi:PKD repeat protein